MMLCRTACLLGLGIAFALKVSSVRSAPITEDVEELADQLNVFLNYNARRLKLILESVPPEHETELISILLKLEEAREPKASLSLKLKTVTSFETSQSKELRAYLDDKYEELYLNEEIGKEMWHLQQLIPLVDETLAAQIADTIPKYEEALRIVDLDEKLDKLADVDDGLTPEFLDFLDTEPEREEILNVNLLYFREFLQYFLQECYLGDYEDDIKTLLSEIENALTSDVSRETKYNLIDRFDQWHTKFGRFVNRRLMEFELYKFSK